VPSDYSKDPAISFGPFRLLPKARLLEKDGAPVRIGGRALDILIFLAERRGEIISNRELVERVWADVNVDEGSLRFHVTTLRKALGDSASGARYVVNVPGRGYYFAAAIVQAGSERVAPPIDEKISGPSLPAPLAQMIGRAESISKISSELERHRFVTVVGPGGIGKTSVTVAVARRQLAVFAGAVFFIDFSALRSVQLVPGTIASVLGLTVSSDNPVRGLLTFLRQKRMLLIFDGCERVLDALAPLAESIIREAPELHILATSRESFRTEGERVHRLFPLDCPPQRAGLSAAEVLAYPAAQLFVERVTAHLGEFELSDDEAPLVAEICAKLDGIALAIELAAGRVNAYGIAGTASLLNSRFSLLWQGRRMAVPRHQTLSAALAWSYDLLPAAESAVLRRLSVFVGPFTLDAAVAVAAGEGVSEPEVIEGIANLVAKSLIATPSAGRLLQYRLLDTTRAYGLEKLEQAGETGLFAPRHTEYFRDLFERAETELETRPDADWLTAYGREIDNVRTALDWAFSPNGDAALGIALTIAVVPLWARLSLFRECRERTELALSKLDEGAAGYARLRMQLSAALGWSLMYGEGRAREAGSTLATTLELAERLNEKDYRLRALWGLCIDQFNNGEFGKALEFAHRFTEAARNSTDRADLMLADRLMAVSLHYLGDQKDARRHIDSVDANLHLLEDKPKIFPLDLRVSTHYFRARVLWLQGFSDQALDLVERNIDEGRANGHALTFCSVLGQGACPITFWAGDLDAAERYGTALLEHAESHAIRVWRLWAGAFNAMVMARRGNLDAGLPLLRNELNQAGDTRFLPRFLPLLGEFAACLGETNEVGQGLAVVDEILARCKTRHEQWYVPELLRVKGELILKKDHRDVSSAEKCFGEALELSRRQGALFWELRNAVSLARLRVGQERKAEARQVLTSVCGSFTEGVGIADMRKATALLASLN
jgi:predicted ATPase/DNA-binding winged helix-turn-helix (wHTH) protein